MMILCSPPRWKLWSLAGVLVASSLAFSQESVPVKVELDSSPRGANVYLDGTLLGVTPCNMLLTGAHLKLDKPGFLPDFELVRNPGRDLSLWIYLRPGTPGMGTRPTALSYPPSRGRPPAWLLSRPDRALHGHPYAIPPDWNVTGASASQVAFETGDGVQRPRRAARLTIGSGSLPERQSARLETMKKEGWSVVFVSSTSTRALVRYERAHNLAICRAASLLESDGGQLLELFYEYPDSADVFTYTRDLDFLRAALGLSY